MRKFLFIALVSLFLTSSISAAVKTWDGGGADGNWTTPENWDNDIAPQTDDDLVFPDVAAQFTVNNNFFIFANFNSLTIEGGNYTITGNPFRLMDGLRVVGGTNAINTAISILSPQTFNAAQGSTTTIAAVDFSGFNLAVDGEGAFGFGFISGTGNFDKNGLGATLIATANGYNGAFTVNDGILVVDADLPNSPVLVNAQTLNNGFGLSGLGGTGEVGNTHIINGGISAGTLTSPTGILSVSGNFDIKENGIVGVKIGGITPGENGYDQFKVGGLVLLNNSVLAPIPTNGFLPSVNQEFTIIDNEGTDPVVGTFSNAPEGARFSGALNSAFEISYIGGDGNDVVIKAVQRSPFDFDGDGKSDISTFRPSDGNWNILRSGNSNFQAQQFGSTEDKISPADFDGDTKTDFAVFRPSNGFWYILNSTDFSVDFVQFGASGDIPMPNDFDGDGRADVSVFRPSNGVWYELRSLGNQFFAQQFGQEGDTPLMTDFDGDGMGDLCVFRPSTGDWHFWLSETQAYSGFPFGLGTDTPIPADYDGDGKTDVAIFRGATNSDLPDFYILLTADFSLRGASWGLPGDIPVVADYDGDGADDVAVLRPTSNDWFLLQSTDGFSQANFGQIKDRPVPATYNQ